MAQLALIRQVALFVFRQTIKSRKVLTGLYVDGVPVFRYDENMPDYAITRNAFLLIYYTFVLAIF